MRNYFNKALFFQQWISLRFIIAGVTLFWIFYSSNMVRNELGYWYSQVIYGNGFILPGINFKISISLFYFLVIISAVMVMLIMGIGKYKKFIFYGGQPLTRNQLIGTNGIFVATFSIAMVLIDYYIRLLSFLKNRKFFEVIEVDYFKIINVRLLILIGLLLALTAFFFLIQGLYSNAVVSSLIGIGAIYYIPVLLTIINGTLSYRFWPIKKFFEKIMYYMNSYYDSAAPDIGFNKFGKWYTEFTSFKFINYQHYLLIVVLILITIILWIINFRIYNVIKIEKVGSIFHFNIGERVFKIAVAIFAGLIFTGLIIAIFSTLGVIYRYPEDNNFNKNILPILNIVSLILIPIIYKLEGKLIKRFVKC